VEQHLLKQPFELMAVRFNFGINILDFASAEPHVNPRHIIFILFE